VIERSSLDLAGVPDSDRWRPARLPDPDLVLLPHPQPTVFYLEETLALLESYGCDEDASGLCTSSGMSHQAGHRAAGGAFGRRRRGDQLRLGGQVYAARSSSLTCECGSAALVGGDGALDIEAWSALVDENTRFLYARCRPTQQSCFDVAVAGSRTRAGSRSSWTRRSRPA